MPSIMLSVTRLHTTLLNRHTSVITNVYATGAGARTTGTGTSAGASAVARAGTDARGSGAGARGLGSGSCARGAGTGTIGGLFAGVKLAASYFKRAPLEFHPDIPVLSDPTSLEQLTTGTCGAFC